MVYSYSMSFVTDSKIVRLRGPVPAEIDEALLEYSPLFRALLYSRGITTREAAAIYLSPDYERDLHSPMLIEGLGRAVLRILRAIEQKERIVVYADYDCDGIPGAVIMHDFFTLIDYDNFSVYIPHRYREGYSLNIPAIMQFAQEDTKLIITVDAGITDHAQVARAQELGIDVIVTDHHLPHIVNGVEDLPNAYAVVNSKQTKCTYPFQYLSGAGVAFKLVQALLEEGSFGVPKGSEKWLLDMVGLAVIADMVPLTGENRILAHFGLRVLRKSRRPGLLSVLRRARARQGEITEDDVGYLIAPRINAASRMGEPMRAFQLLSTRDNKKGDEIADYLERLNRERKKTVARMLEVAESQAIEGNSSAVLLVGREDWYPGVLGLVANKMAEAHLKPVFAWGMQGSPDIKGSCRSYGSVNMVLLMQEADTLARSRGEDGFTDCGGHAMAGGFSLDPKNILNLATWLNLAYLGKDRNQNPIEDEVLVDGELTLDDLNWNTYRSLESFGPFGMENERPIFLIKGAPVERVAWFGAKEIHLRLSFQDNSGRLFSAVRFSAPLTWKEMGIVSGDIVDIVGSLEKSNFMGRSELRLRLWNLSYSNK